MEDGDDEGEMDESNGDTGDEIRPPSILWIEVKIYDGRDETR